MTVKGIWSELIPLHTAYSRFLSYAKKSGSGLGLLKFRFKSICVILGYNIHTRKTCMQKKVGMFETLLSFYVIGNIQMLILVICNLISCLSEFFWSRSCTAQYKTKRKHYIIPNIIAKFQNVISILFIIRIIIHNFSRYVTAHFI